ncbi:MAG: hypothetical protein ACTSYA_02910 [Candidatus Kariarchaeaceae archaeon]
MNSIDEIQKSRVDIENKIKQLEALVTDDDNIAVENAIEDLIGELVREANSEEIIDKQKKLFERLFNIIDETFQWNPIKQDSLYGVINRASLRALLNDPEVSVKTKRQIMDNWEDYM